MEIQRIISSTDFKTGNIPFHLYNEIRQFNENPVFDPTTKPYKFINKVKSSTNSYGWHFEYEGKFYIALHYKMKYTEHISIYQTDKKQKYNASFIPLKTYIGYVDIETVVDMWLNEKFGLKIETSKT